MQKQVTAHALRASANFLLSRLNEHSSLALQRDAVNVANPIDIDLSRLRYMFASTAMGSNGAGLETNVP